MTAIATMSSIRENPRDSAWHGGKVDCLAPGAQNPRESAWHGGKVDCLAPGAQNARFWTEFTEFMERKGTASGPLGFSIFLFELKAFGPEVQQQPDHLAR
ncbi:MAG: hypothetical protein NTV93_18570 [Verrucomicrobia bacterium]|nr:hypothetical protein [Verrucomicrobiota bacterium]